MNDQQNVRQIRKAIDDTDDGILELIELRIKLAGEMAAAKQGDEGHSPLRPAREAAILERLRQRARSASALLIEVIWRELIGQGRQAQGPMRLVLFSRADAWLIEECARRHFSSAIAVEWAESREEALEAACRYPVIAVLDAKVEDSGLTSLGELRTLTGALVGFAYARVTSEANTP